MGRTYKTVATLVALAVVALFSPRSHAQAALLLEQPYGVFGFLNPTGHNAIYFQRICAETPVKLRRCQPGEMGAVIARYQGIDGYDWVAIPLIPYLYSVVNAVNVPARVDHEIVTRLRNHYKEVHLQTLGDNVPAGNFARGGWTQLVGAAYERRIYAFRFDTTPEQDDALIARMNAGPNRTHFELLYSNCADFVRVTLDKYFPRAFRRSIFPDAGITTPDQITWKLIRYAHKHPGTNLEVFEIPQIPGYRRASHSNKSVAGSLSTTGYAIPIALLNPYIAGGLFVDYVVRGRFHDIPKHPQILGPGNLSVLTVEAHAGQNPESAGIQAASDTPGVSGETEPLPAESSGLREIKDTHE